jgi:hypothetical protein
MSGWGGPEGEAARWRNDSTRRSRHKREVTAARRAAHLKRLRVFMPLMLVGMLVLGIAVTSDSNNQWLQCARTVTGIALVLPLIVEMMIDE